MPQNVATDLGEKESFLILSSFYFCRNYEAEKHEFNDKIQKLERSATDSSEKLTGLEGKNSALKSELESTQLKLIDAESEKIKSGESIEEHSAKLSEQISKLQKENLLTNKVRNNNLVILTAYELDLFSPP